MFREKINNDLSWVGQRFGKYTVIGFRYVEGVWCWECQCDCGNVKILKPHLLKTGHTKSCGCYRKSKKVCNNFKHGASDTKLFGVWTTMKNRCYNINQKNYANYGGRGITVCKEWRESYLAFQTWAITNGYREGLMIDRIDNNGEYAPENCRWTTREVQNRNKRSNIQVTFNGRTMVLKDWAREQGISYSTVQNRIKRQGKTPIEALELV